MQKKKKLTILLSQEKYLLRTIGEFTSIDEVKNIGLATTPSGSIIRLRDVAQVKDSYMEPTGFARLNVRPVVSIYIQKESTANTIRVVDGIKGELAFVEENLDQHVKLATTFNQAEFIKGSIDSVNISLLQGAILATLILLLFLTDLKSRFYFPIFVLMALVFFVPHKMLYIILLALLALLLFLKNLRFILIISLAIPISVMATFVLMYLVNFSRSASVTLNIMTLAGLALGIGMLVDNGIVVLENITRRRQDEKDPRKAAISGSQEVTMAIVAGTLTTVIVFFPIIFVNAQTRLLYGPFAITVIFSLLASLLVSITVVPLLSSKTKSVSKTPLWIPRFRRVYRGFLVRTLRGRYNFLIIVFLLFAVGVFFFGRLDREFLGATQQSDFTIFIRMPTGTKLEMSNLACRKVEGSLKTIPEVKSFSSRVEPWISKVYVTLIPSTERTKSPKEIIEIIRRQTDQIKLFYPQDEAIQQPFIYFEEPQEVGTKEIIIDIFGYDYTILRELAVAISQRIGGIKGLTDAKIRMREGRPEMGLIVDRQKAALFGLNVNDIALAVHAQMRGLRATYYHTEGKEVETVARIDEKYRRTFKDLKHLVLSTPEGENIFLKQTSNFKFGLGPSEIWRKGRSRMIQLSASVGTVSLGKAVRLIKEAVSDIEFPEDYFYRFGGNYPELVESQKQTLPTIILMLALVYMVLAGFFESYHQPLIIMCSIPLTIIGVTAALFICRKAVSMGVIFALVLLGGIVVNNAIILIDRANQLRKTGINPLRSIVTAAQTRLRPIVMTTSTTVLGLLPLALDKSESANLWSPLAISVIAGLLSSTVLTLFIVPSVYIVTEDIKKRLSRKPRKLT